MRGGRKTGGNMREGGKFEKNGLDGSEDSFGKDSGGNIGAYKNGTNESSIKDKVMDFFRFYEGTGSAETEAEREAAEIIRRFFGQPGVNSETDLKSLTNYFENWKIPEYPSDVSSYMDFFAEKVAANSTRTSSPRFIGHMTSALPYFMRPLSKLLTAMNQNVVKVETSKALSPLERQSLAMLHRLIYKFPDEFYSMNAQDSKSTLGIVTSGGTTANIIALWCARNSRLSGTDGFAGVEAEGMDAALKYYGYDGAAIIGSAAMHYSFEKAADLLGIGVRNLIKVPVDRFSRIDTDALRREIDACRRSGKCIIAVIGIAGSTDCGSVDPIKEMAEIAKEAQTHFHVDAAWGGPLLFSEKHRGKLEGIDMADTVTIDGHKQLYLPIGIGMVFMRNPHLASVIEKNAKYIIREGSVDLGKRSLEGSRPGMAVYLHAALNIIGEKGFGFLVDEGVRKSRHMADLIRSRQEFELLSEPETNLVVYRYIPAKFREKAEAGILAESENRIINRINERLQKEQRRKGKSFVSRTTLDSTGYGINAPVVALRAVVANPLTSEKDIEAVLDEQARIGAGLEQTPEYF